jgi:hypothetical protein
MNEPQERKYHHGSIVCTHFLLEALRDPFPKLTIIICLLWHVEKNIPDVIQSRDFVDSFSQI